MLPLGRLLDVVWLLVPVDKHMTPDELSCLLLKPLAELPQGRGLGKVYRKWRKMIDNNSGTGCEKVHDIKGSLDPDWRFMSSMRSRSLDPLC